MSEQLIIYTENELTYVPALVTITIKASATTIKGKNSNDFAFKDAQNTLETVQFEQNPQLQYISSYCFYKCTHLSSIDISVCSKLEYISGYAFASCSSLKSINFPESLTSINQYSFAYSGLTSVLITKNVKKISESCFGNCYSLSLLEFEPGSLLESFGGHVVVFSKISTLTFPRYCKTISGTNFDGCTQLISLNVDTENENMVSINNVIFSIDMTSLLANPPGKTGDYTIPEGVKTLAGASFGYSRLTSLNFNNDLESIESWCFNHAQLSTFNLPLSLKTIEGSAFQSCSKLKKITIPGNVTDIGTNCFNSCSNLVEVVLPSSLKKLGGGSFTGCSDQLVIKFSEDSNLKFDTQFLIVNNDNTYITQCLGTNTTYTISSTYITIGASSFSGNTNLNSIIFNSNSQLETIENNAFDGCTNLNSFVFPFSIQTIGNYAFRSCESLSEIIFGQNLVSIGESAFEGCKNLTTLKFDFCEEIITTRKIHSDSTFTLGDKCFKGCSKISTFSLGTRVQTIGADCFRDCSLIDELHIPNTCNSIGIHAFDNCTSLEEVEFIDGSSLSIIPSYFCANCKTLKSVTFPTHITIIDSYAFQRTSISEFNIPSSVVTLGDSAFEDCKSLSNFSIPNDSALENIGLSVFTGCSNFSTIETTCRNYSISYGALFDSDKTRFILMPPASKVRFFSFPETVEIIGNSALDSCNEIEIVFIPESVTTIKPYAFRNCYNLKNINLPYSVTEVGLGCFSGCSSLQCGLVIENVTQEYTRNLIETCNLPRRCLSSCNNRNTCHSKTKIYISVTMKSFMIFINIHKNSY